MSINLKKIFFYIDNFWHGIFAFITKKNPKKPFLVEVPFTLNLLVSIFFIIFFSGAVVLSFYKKAISTPYPLFIPQNILYLGLFSLINLVVILALYQLAKLLQRFNFNLVVIILLSCFFIGQIVFIFLMPAAQCYDPEKLINFAKEFLDGNYTSLEMDQYLNYYPNNIGITLFFAFIFKLLPVKMLLIDGLILRIVNVLFSMILAIFFIALYKEFVSSNKKSLIFALCLFITYPVSLMENTFAYNNLISTVLCLAALYFAKKFIDHNKIIYLILVAVLLMIGNFIRPTALLFAGAIILYFTINAIFYRKVSIIKALLGIILTIAIFNLPFNLFNDYGLKHGILTEPIGEHSNPVWRWINIGIPYDNKLGYWDDGRNISLFRKVFKCDRLQATEFFELDAASKIQSVGPLNITQGYMKKAYWLWTDGTYDANFISLGDNTLETYFIYETSLTKYFHDRNSSARQIITWYLYAYNWLIMLAIIFMLIYSIINKKFQFDLIFYVLLAFFSFYLIWEIKGRYLLNIFPLLLLILAACFEKIGTLIKIPGCLTRIIKGFTSR